MRAAWSKPEPMDHDMGLIAVQVVIVHSFVVVEAERERVHRAVRGATPHGIRFGASSSIKPLSLLRRSIGPVQHGAQTGREELEAERFPELARAWYDSGPARSSATFAGWFEALDRRGLLDVDDPLLAAQHFNWLVLSIPLNKAMSRPVDKPLFTKRQLDRYADEGVRVFLAAYGAHDDG